MTRRAIPSDIPGIRTLMQLVEGFWQAWWSDETIADALQSAGGLAFVWEEQPSDLWVRVRARSRVPGVLE